MPGLYETLIQAIDRTRAIGRSQYEVQQNREPAETALSARIRELFRNLPTGLGQFSLAWLTDPETTYLRIDRDGPEGNITYQQALRLTRIGFQDRDGEIVAVDLDRREDLGLVNEFSFRSDWSREPEWMKYHNHPEYRRVWRDPVYRTSDCPKDVLLVLTGPLLVHSAVAAMAQFAASVFAGGQAEIAPINRCDRAAARLREEKRAIEERAVQQAKAWSGLSAVEARCPELVRDIASMDWTYDYADRPSRASGEQEQRIRRGLADLSLDEAAAVFVARNPIYWAKLPYYLMRHPALIQAAA